MLSRVPLAVLASLLVFPAMASAQASITGLVRDASAAVLPGVTVEAASPALIEKVRTAVSDGTGRYRIENLRPGRYVVTFTLPGFAAVKREGIELTGAFVATVNADLRVGGLEETVTVTGESPIVDVQSTAKQRVLDQEVMSAMPAGRTITSMAALTPGIISNRDVGGNLGDGQSGGGLDFHGVGDSHVLVGGLPSQTSYRQTQGAPNVGAYQEITVETGTVDAEQEWGGVNLNIVPREGGNRISGMGLWAFANESMSWNNLTQKLRDQGLPTPANLKQLLDINPTIGGPIVQNKVWFNTTARYNRAWNFAPMFFNKNAGNPNVWVYEPDTSRRPANEQTLRSFTHRVTWQATQIHKIAGQYESTHQCDCPRQLTGVVSPEANTDNYTTGSPYRQTSLYWTAPVSNRLLLEASALRLLRSVVRPSVNPYFAPSPVPLIQVLDQALGLTFRGAPTRRISTNDVYSGRAIASYVTGAHAFKTGFVFGKILTDDDTFTLDAPISYRFQGGVPNQLTLFDSPFKRETDVDADHGVFVQDRWTVGRLTASGGLRYTFFRIKYPSVLVGPGEWTKSRNIVAPEAIGATWHDLSPRTSAAYDVFGNGKTAVKASLNHYPVAQDRSTLFGEAASPVGSLITTTNRSWTDANRNFVPDCVLTNTAANGECGAMSNPDFGSARPGRAYDRDLTSGWQKRNYNWQFSTGVQHEILPRVAIDAAYWRTWFGNQSVIDDRSLSPADFDQYSIVGPVDSRLPDGGGEVITGLYTIKPEKFGIPANEYVTFASNFGKFDEHLTGFDFTVNARPRAGLLVMGGTSTQRQSSDNCEVVAKLDNPGQRFCDVTGSFTTQVKLLTSYTVPRADVQVSMSIQSLPGPSITSIYTASNEEVRVSLGRNLAGGARNVSVSLVEPRSMFGERMNQVDLRTAKILRFGRTRTTVGFDVYNLLNSATVLTINTAYQSWLQPREILTARFAKIILQVDF
jgi:hypothetical protein